MILTVLERLLRIISEVSSKIIEEELLIEILLKLKIFSENFFTSNI